MTLVLPRRRFLSLLGLGAAAVGVEHYRRYDTGEECFTVEHRGRRYGKTYDAYQADGVVTPIDEAMARRILGNEDKLFGIDARSYPEWKAATYVTPGADGWAAWEPKTGSQCAMHMEHAREKHTLLTESFQQAHDRIAADIQRCLDAFGRDIKVV